MGCLHRISFIIFSIWWKGLFTTLFWYGSPFGLMIFIAPCFLGNLQSLVSWSLSEEATSIYTLTEFNKAPLFHQSLGPNVSLSLSLSLSLFLADSLECKGRLPNPGNINLFFHFLIIDSRPPGSSLLKDPNTQSFIVSLSLLKFMSIELIVPSNHLILYCLHLLMPSIFPNIRVFSNEWALCIRWPKY